MTGILLEGNSNDEITSLLVDDSLLQHRTLLAIERLSLKDFIFDNNICIHYEISNHVLNNFGFDIKIVEGD